MDLDSALGLLGGHAGHPALDGLEDRVMTAIADRPGRMIAIRSTSAGAVFALVLGVGSVFQPAGEARAGSIAPFGVPPLLAPSSLLLGDR